MKINCFNIHCSPTTDMREIRRHLFATLLKFLLHIRSQPTPRSCTLIISMSSQQQWKAFTQQHCIQLHISYSYVVFAHDFEPPCIAAVKLHVW